MSEEPVIFEELESGNGKRVGIATLNAERSHNALTKPMIDLLQPRLDVWADDPDIAAVMLQGAGEKAFCAGGDIMSMYQEMKAGGDGPFPFSEDFFATEYRLDYTIHMFPKPLLVWGNGIVMGGGIGLMAGASHRVVTETAQLAMPEITIGLFPDVGATWFLNRMPGRTGLFLGLTGARLNAGDALFLDLADYFVPADSKSRIVEVLRQLPWQDDPELNRGHLSVALRALADEAVAQRPESEVIRHLDFINHVTDHHSVNGIAESLAGADVDDRWLQRGIETLAQGSPRSAGMIFEQYRQGKYLSLKQAFMRELYMAVNCVRSGEFAEGIRALLVDKDRRPAWRPGSLAELTPDVTQRMLARPDGYEEHPLADLPEPAP
ncbi:enoyl-CoA hydratase/isomerase family protein [Ectothiorhodospiraceae bacterium WFHF3C12]|nr:enoyl-CoA hydratase/isomerase family protein [Ectothiorhodospiraceae bacterium WFHF3C12]